MKKIDLINLSRGEKMILFFYEHGKQKRVRIKYEDMVVGLFKKYPKDFHLKGYPKYPDSGDGIHQPLYLYKKKGYIEGANKIFMLTESGIDFAEGLKNKTKGLSVNSHGRLSRNTLIEVSRIKLLEGFSLFNDGRKEKISESDLYSLLGTSARTSKSVFVGRVATMKSTVNELRKDLKDGIHQSIVQYYEFLLSKYPHVIKYFTEKEA